MSPGLTCDEDLVRRLPLPLAQLYRRAHNAKTPLERHLTAYYFWEASLKLLGSIAVVEWAERGSGDPEGANRLTNLARPSLGHWWEFVRRLVPILADAGDESFGKVRDVLLGRTRDDLPRAAGLDASLREALEGKEGARMTVRLTELFERLVRYRNQELGHGAAGRRGDDFYERMGRTILAGVAEVMGVLDVLAGRRLVFVADVRRQASGGWLIERYELIGEMARRIESLERPEAEASGLPRPSRVYLERSGAGDSPSRALHPLLIYEAELGEVFFLNSRRGRQRTEYLSYTTGRIVDRPDLGGEQRELLARVLGMGVEEDKVEEWSARSQAEEAPVSKPEAPPARQMGEFELLSKLGQGGMGVVYRAWQPSLGRQVALKCLLRAGDPKAEARFAREIRALGRVEHPHLVKIFTSGAEGEHWFFAMELLEGATLAAVSDKLASRSSRAAGLDLNTWQEALSTVYEEARRAEEPLSQGPEGTRPGNDSTGDHRGSDGLRSQGDPQVADVPRAPGGNYVRRVVELVSQVAEAAHALHEVGVLHRDIKPGNIIISADGTGAVLMDLGLAQLADDLQGRLTRTRQFVGTLRYASPEQVLAVGDLDRRSDVYSLGATLWELLTLRPMYGADEKTPTPELMQRIQYEEPERLSKYHPGISRDLDAVVHKCLEKDPRRRYGSARELAEELHHFLKGEPVRARPVGQLDRTWRWCRRNPVLAGLVTTLLVSLVAGAGISTYFAIQAYHQARQALAAQKRADTQAEEARRNAAFAVEQRDLALQSFNTLAVGVQEQLKDVPATAQLKQRLLETAMQGLTRLSESADAGHGTGLPMAEARNRLGDIFLGLGNSAAARREYEKALEILTSVTRDEPDNVTARFLLAQTHRNLTSANLAAGEWATARQHALAALAISEALTQADPKDPKAQLDLAAAAAMVGRAALEQGNPKESREYFQRVLDIDHGLAEADPMNQQARLALAAAHDSLGGVCRSLGDLAAARDHYQQAIDIDTAITKAEPGNVTAQMALANSVMAMGDTCRQHEDMVLARMWYGKGLQITQVLTKADRENAQAKVALASLDDRLGLLSVAQGDRGTAREYFQYELDWDTRLAEADPENHSLQRALGTAYRHLGEVSVSWHGWMGARHFFQPALEIAERMAKAEPKNSQAQEDLLTAHLAMGDVYLSLGNLPAAKDHFLKGLEAGKAQAGANPGATEMGSSLARVYRKLGETALRLDDPAAARDWLQKARETLEPRQNQSPSAEIQQHLLGIYQATGEVDRRLGNLERARQDYQLELDTARGLAGSDSGPGAGGMAVAEAYTDLGHCAEDALDFEGAVRWLSSALEILQALQKQNKLSPDETGQIAILNERLAVCRSAGQAINDLGFAASQPKPLARELLLVRSRALAARGQSEPAAEAVQKLRSLGPADAEILLDVARGYALCVQGSALPQQPQPVTAGAKTARETYVRLALEALGEALEHGFSQPTRLRQERDLDPIRGEPGFREVLERARTLAQDPDRRLVENSVMMPLVLIPRGRFQMGSREDPQEVAKYFNEKLGEEKAEYFRNELPLHEVKITRPFYLGTTEVTVGQFRAFVEATGYRTEAEREGHSAGGLNPTGENLMNNANITWRYPSYETVVGDDHPVAVVSWNDATAFCRWLSQKEKARYRLPTEAEWEYACRAGTTTRYWTGDDPETLLQGANVPDATFRDYCRRVNLTRNYACIEGRDGYSEPAPVGEFAANPFGLFDMHGNVWEWCLDGYQGDFYQQKAATDPVGPGDREEHPIRGGCFK